MNPDNTNYTEPTSLHEPYRTKVNINPRQHGYTWTLNTGTHKPQGSYRRTLENTSPEDTSTLENSYTQNFREHKNTRTPGKSFTRTLETTSTHYIQRTQVYINPWKHKYTLIIQVHIKPWEHFITVY